MLSPVLTTMLVRGGLFDNGQVLKTAGWQFMGNFGVIYRRWKFGARPLLPAMLHLAMHGCDVGKNGGPGCAAGEPRWLDSPKP
jgi:hypothetical protein